LTLQDALFWGVLGALVIWGAVRGRRQENRHRVTGWSLKLGLHATVTFGLFCFLWFSGVIGR
jgi:hypothetical protein